MQENREYRRRQPDDILAGNRNMDMGATHWVPDRIQSLLGVLSISHPYGTLSACHDVKARIQCPYLGQQPRGEAEPPEDGNKLLRFLPESDLSLSLQPW